MVQTIDSTQKALMYEIAESGAHVAPKAHAILYMVDTVEFQYPIEKIEEEPASKRGGRAERPEQEITGSTKSFQYKIYPNPNDGRMTLEYVLEDEQGTFLMYDITGKPVQEIKLRKGPHKITFEPKNITSGVYLYRISGTSKHLHQGRIIILK